uniref:Uncharacterized protein n=1 Tax=Vespula pensylvanica TaxID=30213 RepID=A0A834PFS6_VESPE|nr:hypothetical protein H0235_001290 [Vespula pensylvanica]
MSLRLAATSFGPFNVYPSGYHLCTSIAVYDLLSGGKLVPRSRSYTPRFPESRESSIMGRSIRGLVTEILKEVATKGVVAVSHEFRSLLLPRGMTGKPRVTIKRVEGRCGTFQVA